MTVAVKTPKKLIEVGLPLDRINEACAYEKMPGIGPHPRGIHLWWARRPLAAARSMIFAQLVNDPSWKWEFEHPSDLPPNHLKASWAKSRKKLYSILEALAKWENSDNEKILDAARSEIRKSWIETCELNSSHPEAGVLFNPDQMPGLHDPFSGGGAIPLEAQRLGIDAYASDLNPVAVLINKAMIEVPPKFAGVAPINPEQKSERSLAPRTWRRAEGLAADVRFYSQWMRDEARKEIGHLYPDAEITADIVAQRSDLAPLLGRKLTVIAWLWARTVKSPNPAFSHVDVPLISSYVLSNKAGNEAYVSPVVTGDDYRFEVNIGPIPSEAKLGTKVGERGANFRCLISGAPIDPQYIRSEAQAGRMGTRLMAIVANGPRTRVYLSPLKEFEDIAKSTTPSWVPDQEFFQQALGFRVGNYGMTKWSDLFTNRQLVALSTFSDLIQKVRPLIERQASESGLDGESYANAICLYLSFAIDRLADFSNSLTRWVPGNQKVMNLFGKQTLSMNWDFPEAAVLADTVGGFGPAASYIADCIEKLPANIAGYASQANASDQPISKLKFISTDPPYYDNIGYADLSDFFYVWLRHALRAVFPEILGTVSTPKSEELVATPARHGGREGAEQFFLGGMTSTFELLAKSAHPAAPMTIYYAFKQSETDQSNGTGSTGWETFLEAVLRAGLCITGTWPLRSEQEFRMRSMGSNALASSIVLVCRPRAPDSPTVSRRSFIRELNAALPLALDEMTRGSGEEASPVAPVDLSQAIIGPGMAIFSKYAAVLEADGSSMTVGSALRLINRFLAEDDFDQDSQFCLHWFEQHGWDEGAFGEADQLARAKGTAVDGVEAAGVIKAGGGRVRLLRWNEYPTDWDPATDSRLPVWEVLHHLIRLFKAGGENGAGAILATIAGKADAARQLAYRLYTLCERGGRAEEARAYNEIITSWAAIEDAATRAPKARQANLFDA